MALRAALVGSARSCAWAQTGYVRNYALVFLAGVIGLVGYLVFTH